MPWEEPNSEGPTIPPLTAGLPHTPINACRELMLAIVAQAISDKDLHFILSPTFIHYLCYIGVDPDTALDIKIKYLRREIDPGRFTSTRLHAERFLDRAETAWKSWGMHSASR